MSKTKQIRDKKTNARLYPFYKMVSWDLLFYYPIIYLFLTQVKNFSASQVLLVDAFYIASCFVFQIPAGIFVEKIGKKNSLILANFLVSLSIFALITTKSYILLYISFLVCAIGYAIKGICETNILYDSLPKGKKRGKLYSKIDGIGTSRYYIADAITSIFAGFAFVINPYLPLILCLIFNIIATILSTKFKHTNLLIEEKKNQGLKQYFNDLKEAVQFSIESKRILCLLIFFGLLSGIYYNWGTVRNGILTEIQLPEQYFGLVYALIQVIAAIFSKLSNLAHKKFRNKTLSVLGMSTVIFLILTGSLALGEINNIKIAIIICFYVLLGGIKGIFNVLIYRYLNNFTNTQIRTKLAIIRNVVYNIFTIGISLFSSWLLTFTSSSNSVMIVGTISTVAFVVLLYYMRGKVGLKPEQYSEEDLKYSQLAKFHRM